MTDAQPPEDAADKRMKLRYAGVCADCAGLNFPPRRMPSTSGSTKTVRCVECPTEVDIVDDMAAGGS
ncbi:MAG: hypothetical protein V9G13_08230 [Marmoricola sp.]